MQLRLHAMRHCLRARSFYKNNFYKNHQAQILKNYESHKNYPRLRSCPKPIVNIAFELEIGLKFNISALYLVSYTFNEVPMGIFSHT